jgi:tRNA threonylcarbamoyl adenosine modification protein YeaZ
MRVLAIDTALEACATAVLDTEAGGLTADETLAMARGHAEALMPQIARVMDAARVEFADLDRIAVTVGPGSYTGLRVGISAARGIALVSAKPAVGLSTLAAHAAPHMALAVEGRSVVVAIDARHQHVYLQIYGAGGRTLRGPQLAPIADAVRAAVAAAPALIAGSAAPLIAAAWPAGRERPALDDRSYPAIAWIARLGAVAEPGTDPPKPLYLRKPDAQPQDAARLPRQ